MAISKLKVGCVTRYELLRQLGQGELTRVYLTALRNEGENPALVVLKLMRKELAKNKNLRALFLDQAAGTLQLRHPNIVQTHDVVADAEACGLSMEFLDGQPLRQVLERVGRGNFPLDLHLRILCKVLGALDYAHGFSGPGSPPGGVVHRDVSPSNVFLTIDGQVKLLGTGFAQATLLLERELGRQLSDIGYAAPELLLGYAATPSADLFGVGVMLWEALACSRRIAGDSATVVIHQRTSGAERDIERVCPEAPSSLVEICRRALAVSPRERYASAREMKSDLEAYLASELAPSAGLRPLPALMTSHFGAELSEMRLFIGGELAHAERFVPASPEMAFRSGPSELSSEGDWNDETHVVAPLAARSEAASPAPQPSPKPQVREPDTGGHRAFSASLLPAPPAPLPGLSRLAWPAAAALVVVSLVAGVARWTRGDTAVPSASQTLSLQTEPALAASHETLAAPSAVAIPAGSAPEAELRAPGLATEHGVEGQQQIELALDAGSPDAGAAARGLPSAFLALAAGAAVPAGVELSEPGVTLFPSDLPMVDEEEELLQEAIVAAARAHRRAASSRRARPRRPAKPAPALRLPSGALPRPIDEADPYAPRVNE